jgi:hypothetical protein
MDIDHRLAREKWTKAEQTRQNNGHQGVRQTENPEWAGIAAQDFSHPRNKKILHSAAPGVYPT